ncbi:MAG TPA: efflux RND transporter periplasmic adaptor subunit [Acidobacteriaceae bacterium]|nr:efflux RND transporter periplasmic adaptor subunit [Acidobacteriaceae bacterium]
MVPAAIVAAIVVVGVIFLANRKSESTPMAATIPAARVATVQRGSIAHVLSLAGQFQPYQTIDVHPKVSGFIRHIYVDIGDKVRAGQTLAILEVPELQAQLAGTVAEVARSKDEIVRAQHDVVRTESQLSALHAENVRLKATAKAQPGLVAQQELDDAEAKDLAAAAQVDAAKAALSAAQNGALVARADNQRVSAIQGYTNVVAPLDGVITWRYADTGALIQSGTGSNDQALPIVKLAESGLLRLRMPVPEDAVKYVHAGDTMQVRVDAIGRTFAGKIVRFTRSVNFETRTMETEIDVENKNLSIDPGMYANVQLELDSAKDVLTIPVESLQMQGNRQAVYVLDANNRVHQRTVQVGLQGSKLAEIKSGLNQGDRVIDGGQSKYEDGEQVAPQTVETPASETDHASGSMIDLQSEQGGAQ